MAHQRTLSKNVFWEALNLVGRCMCCRAVQTYFANRVVQNPLPLSPRPLDLGTLSGTLLLVAAEFSSLGLTLAA